MTRFFKKDRPSKFPVARVVLGAFGKHPAWPEHIIGLANTDRLVWLKDAFYERGIRANIDSGEWQRLEDAGDHQEFGHLLLWHQGGGEIILGRLWESTDFNSRPRYPMVVCAVCQHLPLQWIVEHVAPVLLGIEQKCRQIAGQFPPKPAGTETTRAQAEQHVLALIEQSRLSLDAQIASAPPVESIEPDPQSLALIADHQEMGPARKGLYNLAFHVHRVMGAYRPEAGGKSSPAPQRVRVPRCAPDPAQAAAQWLSLFLMQLEPSWPMLILAPQKQPFVDIIVGNPGTPEFVCLRASTRAVPLTTQISYPIEPEFAREVDEMIASLGEMEPATPVVEAPMPPLPPVPLPPPLEAAPDPEPSRPAPPRINKSAARKQFIMLVVAGLLILGAACALVMFAIVRRSGSSQDHAGTGRTASDDSARAAPLSPPGNPGSDPRLNHKPAEITATAAGLLEQVKSTWQQQPTAGSAPFQTQEQRLNELAQRSAGLFALTWSSDNQARIVRDLAQVQSDAAFLEHELGSILAAQKQRVESNGALLASLAAPGHFSSAALNDAWNQRRGELSRELQTTQDGSAVQSKARQTSDLLTALDQWRLRMLASAAELKLSGEYPWLAPAQKRISSALEDECDKAVAEMLQAPPTDITRALDKQQSRIGEWLASIQGSVRDLALAQDLIDRGYGASGTPPGETASASQLVERASAAGKQILTDPAVTESLKQSLLDRLGQLSAIQATTNPATLAETAADAKSPPELRLAAWRRLGQIERWPGTVSQLRQEASLRAGLLEIVGEQKRWDSSPRNSAQSELRDAGPQRWARFVEGLSGAPEQVDESIRSARELRSAMQAETAPLDARAQYNLNLGELRLKAATRNEAAPDAAALKQCIATFINGTANLDAAVLDRPAVAALRQQLTRLAQEPEAAGAERADPPGPDTRGWTRLPATETPDGNALQSFSWKGPSGRTYTLSFVRLEATTAGTPPFFLCTAETPVGLCIDALDAENDPAMLPQLLQKESARIRQPGPRSWNWRPAAQGFRMVRNQQWIGTSNWTTPPFPDGLRVDPPNDDSPIQCIVPHAAIFIASKLGCRLPSAQEWTQAVAVQRSTRAASAAPYNLRDASFGRQRDYVMTLPTTARNPARGDLWPDNEIFMPSGPARPARQDQAKTWDRTPWLDDAAPASANAPDDGWLFFWPVNQPASSGPFCNLIGNVAEYVCDIRGNDDLPQAAQLNYAGLTNWIRQPGRNLAVIGGSALSPPSPEFNCETPSPITDLKDVAGGYADVGFRLAFAAAPRPLAIRLAELLKKSPYLPPADPRG